MRTTRSAVDCAARGASAAFSTVIFGRLSADWLGGCGGHDWIRLVGAGALAGARFVSYRIVSLKRIENSEEKLNFWLARLLKVNGEYRSEQCSSVKLQTTGDYSFITVSQFIMWSQFRHGLRVSPHQLGTLQSAPWTAWSGNSSAQRREVEDCLSFERTLPDC